MTLSQKTWRRLSAYQRYRAATTLLLERKDNIAAIIMCARASALHSLAGGDVQTAREHLSDARWFAQRDRDAAASAWALMRHAH